MNACTKARFVPACVAVFVVVSLCSGPTPVRADDRPIRPGDRGAAVTALQQQLSAMGYTVTVDGRYGPQTERAVRHWQRANGQPANGIVGPQTLASLHLAASAGTAPRPAGLPFPSGSRASPEQIIRAVWPDNVEQHAVDIAYRESRLTPTARNACCWGLFQIHWAAHRAWLVRVGVTSPSQLLDAETNARVALALFTAAGWTPWTL